MEGFTASPIFFMIQPMPLLLDWFSGKRETKKGQPGKLEEVAFWEVLLTCLGNCFVATNFRKEA
jgi:hypothetical protein